MSSSPYGVSARGQGTAKIVPQMGDANSLFEPEKLQVNLHEFHGEVAEIMMRDPKKLVTTRIFNKSSDGLLSIHSLTEFIEVQMSSVHSQDQHIRMFRDYCAWKDAARDSGKLRVEKIEIEYTLARLQHGGELGRPVPARSRAQDALSGGIGSGGASRVSEDDGGGGELLRTPRMSVRALATEMYVPYESLEPRGPDAASSAEAPEAAPAAHDDLATAKFLAMKAKYENQKRIVLCELEQKLLDLRHEYSIVSNYDTEDKLCVAMYMATLSEYHRFLVKKFGQQVVTDLAYMAGASGVIDIGEAMLKIWGLLSSRVERLDSGSIYDRLVSVCPLRAIYNLKPGILLSDAFGTLAKFESETHSLDPKYAQSPGTSLNIRIELTPVNDQTRTIIERYRAIPFADVKDMDIRKFENEVCRFRLTAVTLGAHPPAAQSSAKKAAAPPAAAPSSQAQRAAAHAPKPKVPYDQRLCTRCPGEKQHLLINCPKAKCPVCGESPPGHSIHKCPKAKDRAASSSAAAAEASLQMSPGRKVARVNLVEGAAARATYASVAAAAASAPSQTARMAQREPSRPPACSSARPLPARPLDRLIRPGLLLRNRFAVLGGVDAENIAEAQDEAISAARTSSAPSISAARGTSSSTLAGEPPIGTVKAAARSASPTASKAQDDILYGCVDTGATTQHLFPPDMIEAGEASETPVTIMWGDGSTTSTTVAGYAHIELTDERGAVQKLRVYGWGVPELKSPILSAIVLSEKGCALHAEWGKTYLDFRKIGGKLLHLRNDCLIKVAKVGPAACATAAAASPGAQGKGGKKKGRKFRGRAPTQRSQGN